MAEGSIRRRLMRIGGSRALVIPPTILKILNFENDVEVSVDGDTLVVRRAPADKEKEEKSGT
jgi:antitoxin component of MazEF toxin-antitoxin module